jgi:hypothetical protein
VLVAVLAVPAVPSAASGALENPSIVCTITDDRVSELSGLVATPTGYVAINDSNWDPDAIRVFFFTKACKLSRTVGYPTAARDPEDVAVAPDGTIWIADIGDNFNAEKRRSTIALWKLAPGGKTPVIYRLTYPDGPHDAEALLLGHDGQPILVTKEIGGAAKVYVPSAPLVAKTAEGVQLRQAGQVRLPMSSTPNPFGAVGRNTVTGAAQTADGAHVTLRTYADAFEWDVVDDDVVASITQGTPRSTALPDEPQGEAIAYAVDGTGYLTVSDVPAGTPSVIRRYGVPVRPSPTPSDPDAAATAEPGESHRMGLAGMGVAAIGLVIVGLGVALLRRRGRR